MTAALRNETYTLHEGTGRLTLVGERGICGLAVDGRPVLLNWHDSQGSIGQEFFLIEALPPDESLILLRQLVETGFSEEIPLGEQLLPLLRQFPSGTYQLTLGELGKDWGVPEWEPAQRTPWHFGWYYPWDRNLLPTQPDEALNETRVLEWAYAIEAGARPVVITTTTTESLCEFILDGHHKLWGYGLAKVSPLCLCILGDITAQPTWPQHLGKPPAAWSPRE